MPETATQKRPRPSEKAQRQRDESSHGDSFVGKDRTTSPVSVKQAGGFLSTIQSKLSINQPGDIYEQEADQVAEQVMRMPDPRPPIPPNGSSPNLQRKCAACASGQGTCPQCAEEEKMVQRKLLFPQITPFVQRQTSKAPEEEEDFFQTKEATATAAAPASVESHVNGMRGSGQPLPESARAFFEPRFGYDFSGVRVHADAKAAESARTVNARAYTVGTNVTFAEGQYQPAMEAGQRLLAHELTHVVQQRHTPAVVRGASLKVGGPGNGAEREAGQVADGLARRGIPPPSIAPLDSQAASTPTLQRQPALACGSGTTRVQVQSVGSTSIKCLPVRNGAVDAQYESVYRKEPTHKDDKAEGDKEATYTKIKLPLLVYPPATLDAPYVDVFVFFHGHRADYQVSTSTPGHENVVLESRLQEAMTGTDRIGIAPQAPKTWNWSNDKKKWVSTWNWDEALSKINRFDGLIKKALEVLQNALRLENPLEPRTIHVAGHSGGGIGIGEATEIKGGAKLYGDKVQDVTLQDAGYGFTGAWKNLMDWFLHGSPGKTVRILVSHAEGGLTGGDTRSVLNSWFNKSSIEDRIKEFKKSNTTNTDTFEVVKKEPKPDDKKPKPGGFTLESHLEVYKNKNLQGTMVAFFAPGGGHYETLYSSIGAAAAAGPQTTTGFLGEAKVGVQYRVIARKGTKVYKDSDHPTVRGKEPMPLAVLPLGTLVKVTELKLGAYQFSGDDITTFHARIEDDKGKELGWTPLANLAPPTAPI